MQISAFNFKCKKKSNSTIEKPVNTLGKVRFLLGGGVGRGLGGEGH